MAKCSITVKIIVSIAEKNHDSIRNYLKFMLFYYHCRIVNGVEDITDFFICIIIIDRV